MTAAIPLVLTCEHASRAIPEEYADCFQSCEAQRALQSHEGWDIGAAVLYEALAPLASYRRRGNWSRLLIELNRSSGHPALFSRFTRSLSPQRKRALMQKVYAPFRDAVTRRVEHLLSQGGQVLHLSVHTFTPVLNGVERNCDMGLLYDPGRSGEVALVREWIAHLARPSGVGAGESVGEAALRVRRNYPYRGTADGLVTALRHRFPHQGYTGIELEVNQRFFNSDAAAGQQGILSRLFRTLAVVTGGSPCPGNIDWSPGTVR